MTTKVDDSLDKAIECLLSTHEGTELYLKLLIQSIKETCPPDKFNEIDKRLTDLIFEEFIKHSEKRKAALHYFNKCVANLQHIRYTKDIKGGCYDS